MAKQSGWVTINGVHVFIDGKSGKITQGPAKFIGSTLNDLPSNKSSQADLKARLQAKQAEKSPASKAMAKAKSDRELLPSQKEATDKLISRAKKQTGSKSLNKSEDIDSLIKEAELEKDNLMKKWEELSGGKPVYTMTAEQKKLRSDIIAADNKKSRLIFAKNNGVSSNEALAPKSPQKGLTVTHYDGFGRRGSWNEYRIDGKRVSAKEAKAAFPSHFEGGRYVGVGKSATGNPNFDNAASTTKAKVVKNPNSRLHTGRVSNKGDLTPKQQELFRRYVGSAGQGMSGNKALEIAISGKIPTTQTNGGAVAPTSSRQSNSARVSNAKTMGEFLRAANAPATARTRKRGK